MSEFAEQCVLGMTMFNAQNAMTVVDALNAEMFTKQLHRDIFQKMIDLYWAGEAIDAVTMLKYFQGQKEYLVYLADTAAVYGTEGHLKDYIQNIQEEWQMCSLLDSLDKIKKKKDVKEQLDELGDLLAHHRELQASRNKEGNTSFGQAASEFVEWVTRIEKQVPQCGYPMLDEAVGGFLPGTMFTIAARPGGGKSDLALNLAMRLCKRKAKVLYFTLEMTELQLMQRIVSNLLKINSIRIRDRNLTPKEHETIDRLAGQIHEFNGMHFVSEGDLSLHDVNRHVGTFHPDVVIIDYIGLMKRPNVKDQYRALGMISNGLKQMALKEGICVLALSQMNRQIESRKGGKPNLADLRESGDLEQDSDLVGILSPQVVEGKVLSGTESMDSFLYLLKNRQGRTGRFPFRWQPQYHLFEEIEKRYGD